MNKTLVAAVSALGLITASLATGANPASADPNTCSVPYVWRNARPGDAVCVTTETRQTVADENADPTANKQPGGGAYGPDTCAATFVWRQAFPGDTICVSTHERDATLADNAAAASRLASATCQTWRPAGAVIGIGLDDGGVIDVTATAQTLGPSATSGGNGHPMNRNGTATGNIKGNNMYVNIRWNDGWNSQGNLTINPDGTSIGGVESFPPQNQPDVAPTQVNWHGLDKFLCAQ